MPSRRTFLQQTLTSTASLVGSSVFVSGEIANLAAAETENSQPAPDDALRHEVVPFINEPRRQIGKAYGEGLGGRLIWDHSRISHDTKLTPTDQFFVRTRFPDGFDLKQFDPWTINIHGLVDKPVRLSVDELRRRAKPQGVHIMECSGNSRWGGFGLLSAARWSGVPVAEVLEEASPERSATRVLISGFDKHSKRSNSSSPGASWTFTLEQLKATGAFLAVGMNDEPLTKDHGFPLRLVVPGWYGCTCIKWTNDIAWVDDTVPATSQMREFASRTHQRGVPRLAKDFRSANMDQAALPVRVERHRRDDGITYKVVGIMWGGSEPTDKLRIRIGDDAEFEPVESYEQRDNRSWTVWTHTWRPAEAGRYRIALDVDDPGVSTRRLDRGYYARTVQIDDV